MLRRTRSVTPPLSLPQAVHLLASSDLQALASTRHPRATLLGLVMVVPLRTNSSTKAVTTLSSPYGDLQAPGSMPLFPKSQSHSHQAQARPFPSQLDGQALGPVLTLRQRWSMARSRTPGVRARSSRNTASSMSPGKSTSMAEACPLLGQHAHQT